MTQPLSLPPLEPGDINEVVLNMLTVGHPSTVTASQPPSPPPSEHEDTHEVLNPILTEIMDSMEQDLFSSVANSKFAKLSSIY